MFNFWWTVNKISRSLRWLGILTIAVWCGVQVWEYLPWWGFTLATIVCFGLVVLEAYVDSGGEF